MTVLLITADKIAEINAAVEKARANTVPWSLGKQIAIDDRAKPTNTLLMSERRPDAPERPPPIAVLFPGGVRANISFEEQPAGILRHLSVSTPRPGRNHLPSPALMYRLCKLFGFEAFPPVGGRVWVEEWQPDHFAVNVLELAVEHQAGHA